jgi:hypothetical protein
MSTGGNGFGLARKFVTYYRVLCELTSGGQTAHLRRGHQRASATTAKLSASLLLATFAEIKRVDCMRVGDPQPAFEASYNKQDSAGIAALLFIYRSDQFLELVSSSLSDFTPLLCRIPSGRQP